MTDLDAHPPRAQRSWRRPIWIALAVAFVVVVAVGLALFQPWRIFTRSDVDEALPVAAAQAQAAPAAMAPQAVTPATVAPESMTSPASDPRVKASTDVPEAAGQPAAPVESAPEPAAVPTELVVLASGKFVDGEHATSGSAAILQLADGSRFVRLEGFSTSDGPDVDVWITDQEAGGEDWGKYDDGRYVSLGDLKGTDGNQNYAVPADVDLSGLTSVVIWCDRFNVAFGTVAVML